MDGSLGKLGKHLYDEVIFKERLRTIRIVNHPISTSAGANQKIMSMMNYLSGSVQLPLKVEMC